MRKIILCLFLIFILTGCVSKDEYFTKTCTNKVKSGNLSVSEVKKITYNNKDEVTEVIVTKTYSDKSAKNIKAIKKASSDYNNELAASDDILIKVVMDSENKYSVQYTLDVQKLTSEELEMFNLE
ncbi:MAG: hypothetical protein IJ093_02415, partial [Bacilli bacterium]|nr:hypothetical protein [Bacilli bacterium]